MNLHVLNILAGSKFTVDNRDADGKVVSQTVYEVKQNQTLILPEDKGEYLFAAAEPVLTINKR